MNQLVSLAAKLDIAIQALSAPCTCSRDCDREREYALLVLKETQECTPIHLYKPFAGKQGARAEPTA